jgi:hypothetical protein
MAVANGFTYTNGALCYTLNYEGHEFLRVLLLRGCAATEVEINTRHLLLTALPSAGKHKSYKFKPLYFAHNIMSCVYTRSKDGNSVSWLVIWNLRSKHVIDAHRLESTKGLFVRNDENHLYYGTRSGYGRDGSRRWLIRGLDLNKGSWGEKLVPEDLIGADIGRTVCFEIIDGYFYGLSSQAVIDVDENKWNSFYHAFRFRVGDDSELQILPKSAGWRRQATEGAIDNRWTYLSLSKDESSGQLYIHESRKEWLSMHSQSQRTCYKKVLVFPDTYTDGFTDPQTSSANWDSEMYSEVRRAEHLHVGDNGSRGETFAFNNSLVRAYNPSCQSFIDLVNDADPNTNLPCLRLRVRPNGHPPSGQEAEGQGLLNDPSNISALAAATSDEGVHYWPPRQESNQEGTVGRQLKHIINQQTPAESVDWAADERFLIYSPKSTNKSRCRALILISFDPGLHLHGLRKLHGGHADDRHQCIASQNASCGEQARVKKQTRVENATAGAEMRCETDAQASRISQPPKYAATNSLASRPGSDLATYVRQSPAFYLSIAGEDGAPRGFDMTR